MDDFLLLLKSVLVATFALAAISKLGDWRAFREGLADFGVPQWLRKPVGYLLPAAEAAVALLLVPVASAWFAGLAAAFLLTAFTLMIGLNLARGRRPTCNCFGQASARPIAVSTFVRNAVLTACAVAFVALERSSANGATGAQGPGWVAQHELAWVIVVLLGLVLALLTWFNLDLLRQQGRLMLRLDNLELRMDKLGVAGLPQTAAAAALPGLDIGTLAPEFSATNMSDGVSTLARFLAFGRSVVLIFSDPECGPCATMLPRLLKWQSELDERVTLVVVTRGRKDDNRAKLAGFRPENVLLQTDREIGASYRALITPSAMSINRQGLIESPLALGEFAIADLLQQLTPSDDPNTAQQPRLQRSPDRPSVA